MNDIAHTLYNIVQYILGFGPTVMLPLVLFILALCFKVKPAKALRSSLRKVRISRSFLPKLTR